MGPVKVNLQIFVLVSAVHCLTAESQEHQTIEAQNDLLFNRNINLILNNSATLNFPISSKQLPPPLEEISNCYPKPTNGLTQYLIGYGSLMEKASKERTDPKAGESVPIRVYGYERLWNCKGEPFGFSTTYLGAAMSSNNSAYFNGVIFKVPSVPALQEYDLREKFYCRKEILPSRLQILSSNAAHQAARLLRNSQVWIYVTQPEFDEAPSETLPMVQSYVDTFLGGCFEQEELFKLPGYANECVDTTSGWSEHWVNDRIYPRRPFMYQPKAGKIDKLLHDKIPDIFANIKIE